MSADTEARGPLAGLRVVEVGGTLASRMLVKLLTDQGAAVTCLQLAEPEPAADTGAGAAAAAGPGPGARFGTETAAGPGLEAGAGVGSGTSSAARFWDDGVSVRTVLAGPDGRQDELAGQVRRADVLVDASGGALDAAGFDFDRLAGLRPGLIVCRIPSFPSPPGQARPGQARPGQARPAPGGEPDGEWAVAAALGLDRLAGDEPAVEPLPMASTYAAILSGIYITAALLRRDAGAGAMLMEVSLFGAGMMVLDRRLISVADPACADPLGTWRLPIAERYECADGRYLQLQGATPGVAAAVLAAMGHPEWTEEALRGISALPSAQQEAQWRARFAATFKQRTAAEWERVIGQHGGAGAICRTRQEWKDEPHAAASQIVLTDAPGAPRRPGPAIRVQPVGPVGAATAAGSPGSTVKENPDSQADPGAPPLPLPLAGVRVVDLSIILAGPTCGRLLAELGADVVKVDGPGRARLPYVSPWGWLDVNRSKRSMLLDLSQPSAREVLWRLIEDADVLVENFRAGKLAALGFGADEVFARNPALVYTSLNAYDFGGEFTGRAGWEQNAQAISGMQMSRGSDGVPKQVPVPVNDYGTGLLGAFGTLAAVRAARRTGRGQRVLGSLARTASFLQVPELYWNQRGDGGQDPVHLPGPVDFVRCTDGWVAALRSGGAAGAAGADASGPGAADAAGSAGAGAAGAAVDRPDQDCASVLAALRRDGVSCLRAASVADLPAASWIRESGYLKDWQHPAWGEMTNVFARGRSSEFRQRDGWPAPDPGVDGEAILAGLGYGADQIASMLGSGALGAPVPLFGGSGS